MKENLKATLIRAGSFALAGVLLYLALRGVDLARVGQDLLGANYWWAIPIVLATLASHWLRAWRWTFLLEELPERSDRKAASRPITVSGAFAATMIGYLANYVAPRVGEVVRTANVAARYKYPFTSVLGTVITERILDVVTMAAAFLTLPLVFSGRIAEIRDLLLAPLSSTLARVSPGVLALGLLGLTLATYAIYRWVKAEHGARVSGLLESLKDGLVTIARTPRKTELVLSTVLMWLAYGTMAYLPFLMFGFDDAFGISFLDAWGLMLLGAIGVVIPSPGGIGSYHYITIQSLVLLFGLPSDAAASYAILTHSGQLVIYVVTGAFFIVRLGLGFTSTLHSGQEASESVPASP